MRQCLKCGKKLKWCDYRGNTWICSWCGFERSDLFSVSKPRDAYKILVSSKWIYVPEGCLLVVNGEEL